MGGGYQYQDADSKPWLFGLFLLALLLRLACFTGIIASDDLSYSYYAQLIGEGSYVPESHHHAIRYGLILPVGLIYALVGISEWSTIALPLWASSLSVVLLALIGSRLFGPKVGLTAGLLYATFPVALRYATILAPEPVAEWYVLLALLTHVRTENRAPIALGALAGACIGVAYLTKEPTLFVAPALFIDAVLRGRLRQAFGIVVGIGAIVAAEHAYYLATSGDLLFRFHALTAHNRVNATDYNGLSGNLAYRLFKAYPRLMLEPNRDFGVHSLAALTLSGVALWRLPKDRRTYFLLIWASLPWIYLNFGSTSFTRYIVIPTAARYIVFAYPPLFLLAAWLLADLASKVIWVKRAAPVLLATVLLVGVVCGLLTRGTGWRSDQVAVLRVIAHEIERRALGCLRFETNLGQPWRGQKTIEQATLHILSGGKLRECDDGEAVGGIIRQDPLGLPYVALSQP